jgi:hypothetical protein
VCSRALTRPTSLGCLAFVFSLQETFVWRAAQNWNSLFYSNCQSDGTVEPRAPRISHSMEEPADASIDPIPPSGSQPSRAASGGRSGRVIQQQQQPGENPSSSKRFSSFLSHFKREAGTEARLVQLQLKQILKSEDKDKEVFLDSGSSR